MTLIYNRSIARLFRQKCFRRHRNNTLNMSIPRASIILGLPSLNIMGLCDNLHRFSYNRQPLWVKMPLKICFYVLKWASTKCQQFLILHLRYSKGNGTQLTHNPPIGSHYLQNSYWRYCAHLLQLSAHRASTIVVEVQQATKQRSALCCP